MSQAQMEVRLGGIRLTVPIYRDHDTTKRIVAEVNKRIRDIEKRSKRIDTQAFALQAALSFATELDKTKALQEDDTKDTLLELNHLSKSLQKLVTEFELPGD